MKNRRVLLKLSGEALAGEKGTGFDEAICRDVARQVRTGAQAGTEVCIVIGGGNFWRGRTSERIDRVRADQIGMLATVMNAIYVSQIFESEGMETEVYTPFTVGAMTKLFSKAEADRDLKAGKIVFFAGGTGHPYFSTDSAGQGHRRRLRRRSRHPSGSEEVRHRQPVGGAGETAQGHRPDGHGPLHGESYAARGLRPERRKLDRERTARADHRNRGHRVLIQRKGGDNHGRLCQLL